MGTKSKLQPLLKRLIIRIPRKGYQIIQHLAKDHATTPDLIATHLMHIGLAAIGDAEIRRRFLDKAEADVVRLGSQSEGRETGTTNESPVGETGISGNEGGGQLRGSGSGGDWPKRGALDTSKEQPSPAETGATGTGEVS